MEEYLNIAVCARGNAGRTGRTGEKECAGRRRREGRAGGAAFLGGTVYLRRKRFGNGVFSCCPLHCVYCQNAQISSGAAGGRLQPNASRKFFLELQEQGAHNVNLVTPTQYALQIVSAAKLARRAGLRVPFVYNCGGYESVWALKMLKETVDVYLTDFKYMDSEPAKKHSHAQDYAGYAKTALAEMVRGRQAALFFGANGILQKA